jgi:aminobenzoyl-glutamate utilization protein B
LQFAARLQQHLEIPEPLDAIGRVENADGTIGKGSTDVGDVSWVVPVTGFTTACWVPGTPAHSWQAVAAGGTRIGEYGMNLAAETLALTAVDLLQSQETLERAAAELRTRTKGLPWESLMQPGQKPPLDYRNPPSR